NIANRYGGEVCLDLQSDVWDRYPRIQSIANRIKPSSYFSQYGLTFYGDIPTRSVDVEFSLPGEWETVQVIGSESGYEMRESKPSSYASSFVNLVGGLSQVHLVGSKTAFQVLGSLTVPSTKKAAQRIAAQLGSTLERDFTPAIDDFRRAIDSLDVAVELKQVPKTYRQLNSVVD